MTAPTYGSASADTGVGPQPKNQIVVSGKPAVQYLNIETATNCYPGRLVKKGTHDNDLVVCTAGGEAIGVLGIYPHPVQWIAFGIVVTLLAMLGLVLYAIFGKKSKS